ncbi:MAG: hypothetical protein IJD09_00335 [Clostridia bacterium]|nr:hypothetical protein [Clostridia bacterium]
MKKFCKVLAVILAVLMLVTMATACKQEEDDWETGEGTFVSGNENDPTNEDDKKDEGNKTDGSDSSTDKDEGETPSGGDKNNTDEGKKEPENVGDNKGNEGGDSDAYQQLVKDYDETKKYDVASNPLLAESKGINHGIMPSFSTDTTGFVKNNVKLADLKGKTFTFLSAESQGNFYYTNDKGEQIDEWKWFELLKGELGLQIKLTESHWHSSVSEALKLMGNNKPLDVIPTAAGGFPQFLNLSQPLDPYVNVQNLGNSPGVDQMTLDETYYGGGYRCISPIGSVNILLYNETLVKDLGIKEDPHELFQKDQWDWNAFRSFLSKLPPQTQDGKKLFAYRQGVGDWYMNWPMTNGISPIAIDHESKEPNLINNWDDARVLEALNFFADTMKSVQCCTSGNGETLATRESYHRLFSDGTLVMATRVWLMDDCDTYPYAQQHKYNWVPFPKAPNENGRYVAYNLGYTMMVPRVVKTKSNIPYAVKFMELWATRCTEAIMDYMAEKVHFKFDYAARKEYFEFCIKNTYFGSEMSNWRLVSAEAKEAFRNTTDGYIYAAFKPNINMATKHKEISNFVEQAIKDTITYGNT